MTSYVKIPVEQARAASWVIGNSKFTGRKHPLVQAFRDSVKDGVCCGSGTCPDCPEK